MRTGLRGAVDLLIGGDREAEFGRRNRGRAGRRGRRRIGGRLPRARGADRREAQDGREERRRHRAERHGHAGAGEVRSRTVHDTRTHGGLTPPRSPRRRSVERESGLPPWRNSSTENPKPRPSVRRKRRGGRAEIGKWLLVVAIAGTVLPALLGPAGKLTSGRPPGTADGVRWVLTGFLLLKIWEGARWARIVWVLVLLLAAALCAWMSVLGTKLTMSDRAPVRRRLFDAAFFICVAGGAVCLGQLAAVANP